MNKLIKISRKNAEYQIIESLKNNRSKRTKLNQGFIEGIESIKQAAGANLQFTRVIFPKNRKLSDWGLDFLESDSIESIVEMDQALYEELCDRHDPSEFIATFRMPLRELSNKIINPDSIFLLFDRPSDKGNLGSIIRSANSFGIDGVFVLGHAVDPFDPKVVRASLGSVFHTPIYKIESMQTFNGWMAHVRQAHNGSLIGSDSTGTTAISDMDLPRPIVLVLGNESKGMSKSLKEECDTIVQIPGEGNVNSLNVACAGSILLWEIYKSGRR